MEWYSVIYPYYAVKRKPFDHDKENLVLIFILFVGLIIVGCPMLDLIKHIINLVVRLVE